MATTITLPDYLVRQRQQQASVRHRSIEALVIEGDICVPILAEVLCGLAGARAGRQCVRGTRDAYSDGQGGRRASDALFGLRPDEICMIEESVRGECQDGAA
ncbi:MAG: hypothetical protein IPP13_17510 [Kouleothrix sp.]|jgi:hypothetical protein|nr:hypothetical protein [Kouleothrix sp.]